MKGRDLDLTECLIKDQVGTPYGFSKMIQRMGAGEKISYSKVLAYNSASVANRAIEKMIRSVK